MLLEHDRGRSVVQHPTVAAEDDEPLAVLDPRLDAVLDDDGRHAGGTTEDGITHGGGTRLIEHGGRLVEQQQRGLEGERTGERDALGLPAGEGTRRRRGVEVAEPDDDPGVSRIDTVVADWADAGEQIFKAVSGEWRFWPLLWTPALTALVDVTLAVDEHAPCVDAECTVPGCCGTGAGA